MRGSLNVFAFLQLLPLPSKLFKFLSPPILDDGETPAKKSKKEKKKKKKKDEEVVQQSDEPEGEQMDTSAAVRHRPFYGVSTLSWFGSSPNLS